MANEKKDLRKELQNFKYDFDILQKIPCTEKDNKEYKQLVKAGKALPKDIYPFGHDAGTPSDSEFYKLYAADLSDAELAEYLTYKKLSMLKTIKNCLLFFTILTIIGMIILFIVATR